MARRLTTDERRNNIQCCLDFAERAGAAADICRKRAASLEVRLDKARGRWFACRLKSRLRVLLSRTMTNYAYWVRIEGWALRFVKEGKALYVAFNGIVTLRKLYGGR